MNNNPQIFHGEWWVPAKADPANNIFSTLSERMEKRYTGTLTYYGDKKSLLEIYHVSNSFPAKHYKHNNVIWGKDANGRIFTLFNVVMKEWNMGDFTHKTFVVSLILVGEHLLDKNDIRFNRCVVSFPYLRNWAFRNNITSQYEAGIFRFELEDVCHKDYLENVQVGNEVKWILQDKYNINTTNYNLSVTQMTEFMIETSGDVPFKDYLRHISEFSQFLSIALFCEQNPFEVYFYNKENQCKSELLFKKGISENPQVSTLIKYKKLKSKIPSMFTIWHENYQKISPISNYLISSLKRNKIFDAPDFLIIAQALDGYHKRFVNKKNGKDIRKYEDQIEILLNQFKDVEVIKQCKINPLVLKDTRHKYSHLYPDDEESLAVTDGGNLFWLTEKCKILLTCCILNMLGLTNEEINLCCEQSPISQIIDSLPPEID